MAKKHSFLATLALSLLLLAHTERARADSPYDPFADQYLATGFNTALDAYQADPSDPDAYDAALYGYYAQYYASVADNEDDQVAWYYASLYGNYAADFALASYEATGNVGSYYAYYYLSTGATYAYYAYVTFA